MTIRVFFHCDQINTKDFVDVQADSICAAEHKAENYFNFNGLTRAEVDAVVPQA